MSDIIARKKPRQLPPPDNHVARCIWVIDFGTQVNPFDETKKQRRVYFLFELPLEKAVFNPEKGEQPFVVSMERTVSLENKAYLRRDLESWLGRKFSEAEAVAGNGLRSLLGKPALVNVIHEQKDGGEQRAKIIGVNALPKGMQAPEQINPSVFYSIEDGENDVFTSLSDWMQERIRASKEMSGNRPSLAERNVGQATENALKPHRSTDPDEDALNRELANPDLNGEGDDEDIPF